MIKYKLTNQKMWTKNGYQWEYGKWYEVSGEGELCSDGWLHFYHSPELAVLLNPIHANIKNPRLFEVEVKGKHKDDNGLKCGYSKARLIKELELPKFTLNQKAAFAILCSLEVYKEKNYVKWAKNWLSGKDRTKEAADAAAKGAMGAWAAVAVQTAWAAQTAARAATWAAQTAAWASSKKINFEKIIKKIKEIK